MPYNRKQLKMATGNYGIVRPATVTTDDMEIYFTYAPTRDSKPTIPLTPLTPSQVISRFSHPVPNTNGVPLFDGLYNLQYDTCIHTHTPQTHTHKQTQTENCLHDIAR